MPTRAGMNEERALLQAILQEPDDDACKLVYADWLEEQGDPRAEFLRLMMQFRQNRVVTPEQRQRHHDLSVELAELRKRQWEAWDAGGGSAHAERLRRIRELEDQLAELSRQIRRQVPARLRELAATLDPKWLAAVSDPEIECCGKSAGDTWQLRFDFLCDRSWSDLKPTGDKTVRHCQSCNKDVHFCDNIADARQHSRSGHCIAVDLGVIRREGDLVPPTAFLGWPSSADIRRSYEEELDPVSQARLDARKQARQKRKRKK